MQTLIELNDNFGIPGALSFEEIAGGLIIARITTGACAATVFLQGAHLVHWQPEGADSVLFLSERSAFAPGKPIRGGVPVVFPWFGPRTGDRTDGPSHGFARITAWQVAFTASTSDYTHLTLALGPDDTTRALGYENFRATCEFALGRSLSMRLTVANTGESLLHFEEAFHTYLAIGDAEQVRISGLGGTEYLDKTDNFTRKRQEEDVLTLHRETDRPYLNTAGAVFVNDPVLDRRIVVEKRNSETTVVWNPWTELAAKLPDMPDDGWRTMVCIETANVAENAITLAPSEAHSMEAHISLAALHDEPVVVG